MAGYTDQYDMVPKPNPDIKPNFPDDPDHPTDPGADKKKSKVGIVWIIVLIILGLVGLGVGFMCYRKRQNNDLDGEL